MNLMFSRLDKFDGSIFEGASIFGMLIGLHIWEHIFGVGVYTGSVLKEFYGISNGGKLSFSLSYTKAPMATLHKGINGFFLKNRG